MTLPNLQKLTEQAAQPLVADLDTTEARIALKAAAPDMAELLIACEQALKAIKERTEDYPVRPTYACLDATELAAAALARLADFDGRIG